jgi:hypothetical protein
MNLSPAVYLISAMACSASMALVLRFFSSSENNRYGTHIQRCGEALRMSVEMLTDEGQHIAYFDSMSEAAEKSGCPLSSIHRCCYGRQETTNGYRFKFTTDFRKLKRDRK